MLVWLHLVWSVNAISCDNVVGSAFFPVASIVAVLVHVHEFGGAIITEP